MNTNHSSNGNRNGNGNNVYAIRQINTKLVCHQVFYTAKHISIQATKPFIAQLRNADGFGGVDLTDDGGGWYTFHPRSEMRNGEISSEVERSIFLEFARDDLEALIDHLERQAMRAPAVTVVDAEGYATTVNKLVAKKVAKPRAPSGTIRHFQLSVNAPLSTAMHLEQLATDEQIEGLAKRYTADRHPADRNARR